MARGAERFRPDAPAIAEVAAGAVVRARGTSEILLLHHAAQRRWCFPKGHVEAGESLRATAAREVREETGLDEVRLGPELVTVSYRFYDPKRRLNVLKTTVYFRASSARSPPRPEPLFDDARWTEPRAALRAVRFDTDRAAIRALARPTPKRRA